MRFVIRDGELVPKHLAQPLQTSNGPFVISDHMEPTRHMATGATLDSKSAFRAHTRSAGCVEVGTDPAITREQPRPEPSGVHEDVQRAIAQLRR